MPDFGAPIAQNVDVNPNKGLQTLSDLMGLQQKQIGIQQQQQQLQTGAFVQQQQAALAQKEQQQMQERQLLQTSMKSGKDPDGNALIGPNGEADPVAMTQFANKYLPAIGQGVVQNIVTTQDNRLKLNDTMRNVGQNYRADMANVIRSSINDPTQDPSKNLDAYVQQQGPNAPASLTQAAGYAKALLQNLGPQVAPDKRNAALLHLAQQFQPTEATIGEQRPAIASAPGVEPGGGVQLIQTNPLSPVPTGKVGKEIPTGVATQVITPPGGVPSIVGGRGPVPTSFGGTGPPPTQQDVEAFGGYQANLNNRVAVASDLIPRLQQAESALSQIRAGGGAETRASTAKFLQGLGVPQSIVDGIAGGDLAKTQEAEKYLFQVTFAGLKQSMQGDPARVAEFNSAEQVFPNIGTDPRATSSIMKFMTDQATRDYAEQQALRKARTSGDFNPVTWQADYQQKLRAGTVPGVPPSQVPTTTGAPAKSMAMPTGERLKAYADKYTGGDLDKATQALKVHGYH